MPIHKGRGPQNVCGATGSIIFVCVIYRRALVSRCGRFKRVKNSQRSTMMQERLNSLESLSTNCDATRKLDFSGPTIISLAKSKVFTNLH